MQQSAVLETFSLPYPFLCILSTFISTSAESCAHAFIFTWISRFDVPALLTSDSGAQFTSSVWARVCETLKISHPTTTSFHLQSNRMVERFHCSLKSSLRAFLAGQDWVQHLPLVLLGLHTTPKEDSGYAPAEALYCTQLAVPGEFLEATDLPPTDFLQKIDSAITGFFGPVPHCTRPVPKKSLPKALLNSEFVFVREDASSPLFLNCIEDHTKLLTGKINISSFRMVPSWITFQLTG